MDTVMLLAGLVVLATTLVDVAITTLAFGVRRRPLSLRLVSHAWSVARRLFGRHHAALSTVGPAALAALAALWILAIWAGWSLVFLAARDGSLVDAETGAAASGWDTVYFAGYTLTTLGTGSFETLGSGWQVAEVLASMSGFLLATLGISFVLSVVNAVVDKRSFAADLHGLGATPTILVRHVLQDGATETFESTVRDASTRINHMAQQHLAYPVLHYFHSRDRVTALAPSLAVMDEAINLLETGTHRHRIDPMVLRQWHHARDVLLRTLRQSFQWPTVGDPPFTDVSRLSDELAEFAFPAENTRSDRDRARRRTLAAFTEQHGWDWRVDVLGEDRPRD